MQPQKIIIIAIVFLAIGLLGVLTFGLWLQFGNKTPTQPSTNTQTPSTNTQTGTQNPSTNTQTPSTNTGATVDIKKEYDKVFANLSAKRVSLELVGSADGHFGDVYKLYAADVELAKKLFPKATGYTIHIGSLDLNADGTAEVVVYEDMVGMCGSAGCPIDVYQKSGSTYKNILSTIGSEMVGAASSKTSGFTDLLISSRGETSFKSNLIKYSWNGSLYARANVVATWDGSTFTLVK